MSVKDYVHLHVANLLDVKSNSTSDEKQWRAVAATYSKTKFEFYVSFGLLKENVATKFKTVESVILRLSDITEE